MNKERILMDVKNTEQFIGKTMDDALEAEMIAYFGQEVTVYSVGTAGDMVISEGRVRVWLAQDNTVSSITFG
jgi:hypothetical protein